MSSNDEPEAENRSPGSSERIPVDQGKPIKLQQKKRRRSLKGTVRPWIRSVRRRIYLFRRTLAQNWIVIGLVVSILGILTIAYLNEPSAASVTTEESSRFSTTYSLNANGLPTVTVTPLEANQDQVAYQTDDAAIADLLAQERMAHWTGWIAALTGIGLIALVLTLIESVVLSRNTKQIGQAQVRAYLGVEEVWILAREHSFEVRMKVRNFGQSPAFDVTSRIGQLMMTRTGIPRQSGAKHPSGHTPFFQGFDLGSAESTLIAAHQGMSVSSAGRSYNYPEERSDLVRGALSFEIRIKWLDVFDEQNRIHVVVNGKSDEDRALDESDVKRELSITLQDSKGALERMVRTGK